MPARMEDLFPIWNKQSEFANKPYADKARILTNYFNRNLADERFSALAPERQESIKGNFVSRFLGTPSEEGLSFQAEDFPITIETAVAEEERDPILDSVDEIYEEVRRETAIEPEIEPEIAAPSIVGEPGQSWLESITEGLTAGWYGLSAAPLVVMEAISAKVRPTDVAPARLERFAKETADILHKKAEEHPIAAELQGKNLWDNPEIILDPRFTLHGIGTMAPSFLAAMIPGFAFMKYGRWIAGGVSGMSAGVLEGVNTYRETLERGESVDEAFKNMILMTVGSGILNSIAFGRIFKKFKGKKLIQITGTGLLEAGTEYAEVPLESEILGVSDEEYTQRMKDGLAVIGPALFMGSGGSTVTQYLQKGQENRVKRLEQKKDRSLEEDEQLLDERKAAIAMKDMPKQPFKKPTEKELANLEKMQKELDAKLLEEVEEITEKIPEEVVEKITPEVEKELDEAAAALEKKAIPKKIKAKIVPPEELSADKVAFIDKYIEELGKDKPPEEARKAVTERWSEDTAEDIYARAKVEELFPVKPVEAAKEKKAKRLASGLRVRKGKVEELTEKFTETKQRLIDDKYGHINDKIDDQQTAGKLFTALLQLRKTAEKAGDQDAIAIADKGLDELRTLGFEEIGDELLGQKFNEGLIVEARFISGDENAAPGQIITKIVSPGIARDGKQIQVPEIEVTVGEEITEKPPVKPVEVAEGEKVKKKGVVAQKAKPAKEPAPQPAKKAKEEVAVEEKPEVEKEPWEMTLNEFLEDVGYAKKEGARVKENWRGSHEGEVRKAFVAGKPVPAEVLADYPDLAKKKPISALAVEEVRKAEEKAAPIEKEKKLAKALEEEERLEAEVEVETKGKEKTVSVDLAKKEETGLTLAQQKKYLVAEIDTAIKAAPETGDGKVIIEVPGDGVFTITNNKQSLQNFKKATRGFPAAKMKPIKPGAKRVKIPTPLGRRLKGVEYYNPFRPRKQKIIVAEDETQRQFYVSGFYTDGHYAVKVKEKPAVKVPYKPITKELKSNLKSILTPGKDETPVETMREYAFEDSDTYGRNFGAYVHAVSEKGRHLIINAQLIDVVLTEHPKAKITMAGNQLFFKKGNQVVGTVMALRREGEGEEGDLEGIHEVAQGGYRELQKEKKAPKPEEPKFATKPAGKGQSAAIVERQIKSFKNKFAVPIEVVQSIADLPEGLRAAAIATSKKGKVVSGIYDTVFTNKMYLVADGITNRREAVRVVLHETGHLGLRKLFGKDFDSFLDELAANPEYADAIKALATSDSQKDMRRAADEWFAQQAEVQPSLMKRFLYHIRRALRAMGIDIKFNNSELEDLVMRAYKAAKKPEKVAVAKAEEPLFKAADVNVLQQQLKDVQKAIDELPAVRADQPTTEIRKRFEAKREEIETALLESQGGLRFRAKPGEPTHLEKKIASLEAGLPEKGKNRLVQHRLSTLIKNKIKAIKQGHRLGEYDKARELAEIKQLILDYARKNLPKKDITRGQIKPLLTELVKTSKVKDVESSFERIDAITKTVTEKQLTADISKLLKRHRPKKKQGRIRGTVLTADEYAKLSDINVIAKMDREAVLGESGEILQKADAEKRELTPFESEYFYTLQTFGNLREKSPDQLFRAKEELQALIETGRTKRQEKDEARREKYAEIRERYVDILTDKQGILTEEAEAARGGKISEGWIKRFLDANLSLEYLLDKFSRFERGAKPLRGYINEHIMPMVFKSRNAEHRGVRDAFEIMQKKLAEVYGTTSKREIVRISRQNSETVNTGIWIEQEEGRVELVLSQRTAYKRWMEWQDPTLAETFAEMGYTQKTMDAIEDFMTPETRKWAEWQLYEFLPQYYNDINKVFRERYDVDLPYNAFYSPITRDVQGNVMDTQLLSGNTHYTSVYNGHLKSRVNNKHPLKLLDGDTVLLNHIVEMEHFKAWSLSMREMRAILNSRQVQKAIRQYHGQNAARILNDFIDDLSRGGVDSRLLKPILDKLRSNFTTAVLGVNLTLFPKQLASIPAYAGEIPMVDFMKGIADFIKSPVAKFKILMESDMMKARYHKGFERDIKLAMKRTTEQEMAGAKNMRDIIMFSTKMGDAAAIVMGGWSVYKYYNEQALKAGKTKKQAAEIAMLEFERSTKRSQQAGELEDLPSIMRGGSWARLFTMFVTAPNSYFRMEQAALTNLWRGRGTKAENIKKFTIAHFILPLAFQFVANGFRWDDEDQLRAAILGSFNGLLILGDFLEGGLDVLIGSIKGTGTYFFGSDQNPVFQNLDDAKKVLNKAGKLIEEGDYDWEEVANVADAIAKVGSKIVGIPYDPGKRMVTGVKEFIEEPSLRSAKRALGYSEWALGKEEKTTVRQNALKPFKAPRPSKRIRKTLREMSR